jgi:hypothetical protein
MWFETKIHTNELKISNRACWNRVRGAGGLKLFQSTKESQCLQGCSPAIGTPAGTISFDILIKGYSLSSQRTEIRCFQLENGALLASYSHKDYIAELLICEPAVRIPAHMQIEKAAAAVWRLRANNDLMGCVFQAEMSPQGDIGWPNSGERLEAMTWENGEWKLTLGTEDGTVLVHRARVQDMMPDRFRAEDEISQLQIVRYLPNGIAVPIPELRKGELCQVHFTAAWKRSREEGDEAAWFAAGADCPSILSSCGVY